jgi:Ion channel
MTDSKLRHLYRFWNTDRSLTALLVVLVLLLFVVTPLTTGRVIGTELSTTFFSVLAVTGVAAVARRLWIVALLIVTALASIGLDWVAHFGGGSDTLLVNLALRAAFIVLLGVVVTVQVFRPGNITQHRVQGAVVVYLLAGLAWAHFYAALHLLEPLAFKLPTESTHLASHLGLFQYFSFETLTTLGFGDILPISPFARALVSSEALFGQLYPALMIARLVTLELHARSRRASDE